MGKHFTLTKVNDLLTVQPGRYQRYLVAARLGKDGPCPPKKAISILRQLKADTSLGAAVWKMFPG